MRDALDALRSRGIEFTLADLLVRGAEARLDDSGDEGTRRALRGRLADALRDGTHGLDAATLDELREHGGIRSV